MKIQYNLKTTIVIIYFFFYHQKFEANICEGFFFLSFVDMSENIIYTVLALNSCIGFKYVGGVNCCQTEYRTEKQPPPTPPKKKNSGSQICFVATVFGHHIQLTMEEFVKESMYEYRNPVHVCVCVRFLEFKQPKRLSCTWKCLHFVFWWPIHTCFFVFWWWPPSRVHLHVWMVTVGLPNFHYQFNLVFFFLIC